MKTPKTSQTAFSTARKRAVNVTLNTDLVAEAKLLTPNLSATVESLIEGFVARGRYARSNQRWLANLCADDWNRVLDEHGLFADSHAML